MYQEAVAIVEPAGEAQCSPVLTMQFRWDLTRQEETNFFA